MQAQPVTPPHRSGHNRNDSSSYLPSHLNTGKHRMSLPFLFDDSSSSAASSPKDSPTLRLYDKLFREPAYVHAAQAGFLWQSMVGQHVKFPKHWWDGARGPGSSQCPWMYFGRHEINGNYILNQLIQGRASGGRLLVHICVLDLVTRECVQDIVVGCFHPNAKTIRPTSHPQRRLEKCRDLYIGVRKRNEADVSSVDSLLCAQGTVQSRSPLGRAQKITNLNVRSVFGEKSPLETIFLSEEDL